jgi:hypothetical protein
MCTLIITFWQNGRKLALRRGGDNFQVNPALCSIFTLLPLLPHKILKNYSLKKRYFSGEKKTKKKFNKRETLKK